MHMQIFTLLRILKHNLYVFTLLCKIRIPADDWKSIIFYVNFSIKIYCRVNVLDRPLEAMKEHFFASRHGAMVQWNTERW